MLSWTITLDDHRVEVRSTTVADGDFAIPQVGDEPGGRPRLEFDVESLGERRAAIVDAPWTWLRQVHGTELVLADEPGAGAGSVADGAITTAVGVPIAVTTADCSPVILVSTGGVAVVHAGWRGALAGIVERAGARLLAEGGQPVQALLGPCISVDHYEFGDHDLRQIETAYGPSVRGVTSDGAPGLDMAALVAVACANAGWPRPESTACTSSPQFFSHRARRDRGRQTTVAWIERTS